ncbi:hypothetical protein [Pseudoxanthomonas sp. PXM01]|uniref:hypothetical protein n=1 Tax=Pseudoxanthomonas sp. PXM01 TaxID=2769295 RepID=UPI001781D091|nr:hypothetical protein [Pseudoxanthomonas sp. PXM01]MBD9470116.1 hypothetical protein [Pseudoxanthomonas sp. PXM01]
MRAAWIALALLAMPLSACGPAPSPSASPSDAAAPDSGTVAKQPFLLRFTREPATVAGLSRLEDAELAPGATEIRVWIGFGLRIDQQVLILSTSPGGHVKGSALIHFDDDDDDEYVAALLRQCDAPRRDMGMVVCDAPLSTPTDWGAIHARLRQLGIETLPDESAMPTESLVTDGTSMVVEVANAEGYRAYAWSNPDQRSEPQAQVAAEIMQVVENVFEGR